MTLVMRPTDVNLCQVHAHAALTRLYLSCVTAHRACCTAAILWVRKLAGNAIKTSRADLTSFARTSNPAQPQIVVTAKMS